MDNTIRLVKEAIDKANNIGIAVPKNPNLDQMAAGLSLYLALSHAGKKVSIATPDNPLVEVSSLVGIDRVSTAFESGESGDLVVSFPYAEGEIEKVSYTLENGHLNIVVKEGELGLSFNDQDVKFKRASAGAVDLLFAVGASKISDLGGLFDPAVLKDTTVINLDNKSDNQGFGDIAMVSPKLSSVSEEIGNIILSLEYKMDIDIAQNLMQGISFATEDFQNPKTSSLAFEVAGFLMRNGASRIKVNQNLSKNEDNSSYLPPKQEEKSTLKNPPDDWLEPKIYKGSTNF